MQNSLAKSSGTFLMSQLALIPLAAFLIGRLSITFNGSYSHWFQMTCQVIVLAVATYGVTHEMQSRP